MALGVAVVTQVQSRKFQRYVMAPSKKRPVHLGAKTKAAIPDALNGRDPPTQLLYPIVLRN